MKRRKLFCSSLIMAASFYALLFATERVEAHGTYVGPTEYGSWNTVGCCGEGDTRQKRTSRSRYRYDYEDDRRDDRYGYQYSPSQQREDGLVDQLLAGIDNLLGVFNISPAFATPATPPSVSPPAPPDATPPSASPDSVNSAPLLARGPYFHWHSGWDYRCTGAPSSTCPAPQPFPFPRPPRPPRPPGVP